MTFKCICCNYYNYDVLSTSNVIKASGYQQRLIHLGAAPHLIWVSKRLDELE